MRKKALYAPRKFLKYFTLGLLVILPFVGFVLGTQYTGTNKNEEVEKPGQSKSREENERYSVMIPSGWAVEHATDQFNEIAMHTIIAQSGHDTMTFSFPLEGVGGGRPYYSAGQELVSINGEQATLVYSLQDEACIAAPQTPADMQAKCTTKFNMVTVSSNSTDPYNWSVFYKRDAELGSFTLSLEEPEPIDARASSDSVRDFKSVLSSLRFK